MKTNRLLLTIAIVAASISGCRQSATVKPERRDITQAVYASGKVLPLNHYLLYAKAPGYVEAIHVKAGESVRSGQRLITLRNDVNEFTISSTSNLAALARLNADENGPALSALKQEKEAARARYELDSINFNRNSSLMKDEAISKVAFDQSRTQLDLSRSGYRRAIESYNAAVARYKTEYLNALNQSGSQQSNRKDYDLLSAIDGKVYDVLPNVGDLMGVQSPLIELGDATRFEVELSIDETDIGLLKEGQQVIYGIDAYPDLPLRGVITEIIPRVNVNSKSARVKAGIEVPNDLRLYSGMTVEGNIIIGTRKNALVIPREFVRNGDLVRIAGEDSPRHIRKGFEDLEFVEVLEGLNGDEELKK
jgi:multidrug efflux pump subunit AcrA (membrane-fusion protein)